MKKRKYLTRDSILFQGQTRMCTAPAWDVIVIVTINISSPLLPPSMDWNFRQFLISICQFKLPSYREIEMTVPDIYLREGPKKKRFFWECFPKYGSVGWLIAKPGHPPPKKKKNHPENRLFWPEFHLSFSKISQKPWGGWVGKQIWERYPKKKTFFFWQLP